MVNILIGISQFILGLAMAPFLLLLTGLGFLVLWLRKYGLGFLIVIAWFFFWWYVATFFIDLLKPLFQ